MLALISLFVIVVASLLVTRVATVMLTLTGLSRQSARFQARSAFSGAGFTTSESEAVIDHPVRRRIIMTLMLLGNAGIISGLASVLLTFTTAQNEGSAALRVLAILVFLIALNRLAASQTADRALSRLIERALRRYTDLDIRDYAGLLRLTDNWIIGETIVEEGDWFIGHTIGDLQLPAEGVLVLGIERRGHRYVGAPKATARFHEGDKVVLYGLRETLERIDERDRSADGEMDWVTSQIEFTESYLAQQEIERAAEEAGAADDALHLDDSDESLHLHVGERPEAPALEPDVEDDAHGR